MESTSGVKVLVYLAVGVVVMWAGALAGSIWFFSEWSERGQFGDLFGSVNALFSGLAFAGLIYTILLQQTQLKVQQSELKLQREELKLQREEMAASRAELANQVRVQHAHFKVAVAQIAVSGMNAHIEATKMDSERVTASFREEYSKDIRSRAEAISALADKLETEAPKVA